MKEEQKELNVLFEDIKDKMGITSFEHITNYMVTIWQKMSDLLESRRKWRKRALKAELELKDMNKMAIVSNCDDVYKAIMEDNKK